MLVPPAAFSVMHGAAIGHGAVAGVSRLTQRDVNVRVGQRILLVVDDVEGIRGIPRRRLHFDPLVGNGKRLDARHGIGRRDLGSRDRADVDGINAEYRREEGRDGIAACAAALHADANLDRSPETSRPLRGPRSARSSRRCRQPFLPRWRCCTAGPSAVRSS